MAYLRKGFSKITNIDHWRLTTSFSGGADPIVAAVERDDTQLANLGTGMDAPSSGIWTFPSTGFWWVHAKGDTSDVSNANDYINLKIKHTVNDGTDWDAIWEGVWTSHSASQRSGSMVSAFLDITDTTQQKILFAFDSEISATKFVSSTTNRFWFVFVKLSDT
tara:strand:- start:683 stop:1171 length:489 start_codon:yes stop_codon:yes gene_type:complete